MNYFMNQVIANIFKALAHPTRIHILKLLRNGPMCVCEIIEHLKLEQSNTSQHLNVLKMVGLVESRREGTKVIYKARYEDIFTMLELIEKIVINQTEETKMMIKNTF